MTAHLTDSADLNRSMLGFGRHLAIIAVMPIADAVVHTLLFHSFVTYAAFCMILISVNRPR
jgi:hypothetical protein